MRSIADGDTKPVYIQMFAERERLRESLPGRRTQLAAETGPVRKTLEAQIAKSERDIRDLTNKLPSNMR